LAISYDLVFVGNVVLDEVHPFEGPAHTFFGGPVQFCAMAASWSPRSKALVTKMAERDTHCLDAVRAAGIAVHISPSAETTYHRVRHLTGNVDQREMTLVKSAGFYSTQDLPEMKPTFLHLAGLNDQEFTVDFLRELRGRGFTLALDMQSFVRQVDPETGETALADVAEKREISRLVEKIKLDVVEAEVLTGTADLEQAAIRFEEWGASEIMVTRADGVLVRHQGRTHFERFSNRSVQGRTGRGDTTFGSYLARRLDHGAAESLKFAAALASIKMESPGPFSGTLEQVLERMGPLGPG
jgi:sugar/nucleoside kinase (ribokinase family)